MVSKAIGIRESDSVSLLEAQILAEVQLDLDGSYSKSRNPPVDSILIVVGNAIRKLMCRDCMSSCILQY